MQVAECLLEKREEGEYFIADKDHDSEALRTQVSGLGITPIVPRRSKSQKPDPEFDS